MGGRIGRATRRWRAALAVAGALRLRLLAGAALAALAVSAAWVALAQAGIGTADPAAALALVAAVGLGAAAGWAVLRRIDRRVADLAVYAAALARDEAPPPPPPRGSDPLGDLAEGLAALGARLADQRRRLDELGAHAARLDAPLRAAAAQEERNRLARELHDTIKQQLFSIGLTAAAAEARWEADPAGARAAVAEIRALATEAQVEMRALLTQLRPAPVATVGLIAALREQLDALAYRAEVAVEADLRPLPDDAALAPGAEDALFRIAQEGLANIARHARARQVRATFGLAEDMEGERAVELRLRDDGRGFDPEAAGADGGMGLRNMRDRAAEIDGTLALASRAGEGTELIVRVPLYRAPAPDLEQEGIPVNTKARGLRIATIARIGAAATSVGFSWSFIAVNRAAGLPPWAGLVALALLVATLVSSVAAEQLAQRFRRLVGDEPIWRARLDRDLSLARLAEYTPSAVLVPELLRVIFGDGVLARIAEATGGAAIGLRWLADFANLAGLGFVIAALWATWELLRAELTLLRTLDSWTTRAVLAQERTAQNMNLWMGLLLVTVIAALAPGRMTLAPANLADVVHTGFVALLIVQIVVAAWNLLVAVVRLQWTDEGRVAG